MHNEPSTPAADAPAGVPADAVLPDPAPRDDERFDVIVIGGGPAGLTAATYLARFHRRCVVLDAGDSRARWIPESHNCPGFPSGVAGTALLARMREQAAQFGARLANAVAAHVICDYNGANFGKVFPHHVQSACADHKVVLVNGH